MNEENYTVFRKGEKIKMSPITIEFIKKLNETNSLLASAFLQTFIELVLSNKNKTFYKCFSNVSDFQKRLFKKYKITDEFINNVKNIINKGLFNFSNDESIAYIIIQSVETFKCVPITFNLAAKKISKFIEIAEYYLHNNSSVITIDFLNLISEFKVKDIRVNNSIGNTCLITGILTNTTVIEIVCEKQFTAITKANKLLERMKINRKKIGIIFNLFTQKKHTLII